MIRRQPLPTDAALRLGGNHAHEGSTSTAPRPPDRAVESTAPSGGAAEPPVDLGEADGLWGQAAPMFTYLAGAAGSGKTFAVRAWAERDPGLLLCATTGIAAINLGGTTINATLGYFDTKSLQDHYTHGLLTARLGKLWKAGVRRLVLDEVSMLDGDQLTYLARAVEELNTRGYARKSQDWDDLDDHPALGLTLVGDFLQLPPVKAPFAFQSSEWPRFVEGRRQITLTEIRRQADPAFIAALRAARRGDGQGVLAYFGGRLETETDDQFAGPTILAKNEAVDRYNWIRLNRLTGRPVQFASARDGKQRSEWGDPKKPPTTWGIPPVLSLKIGALVMILANRRADRGGFLYVNGDLGELVDADETQRRATIRLQRTGQIVTVEPVRREVRVPLDSARRQELRAAGQDDRIAEGGKWEITGWITYLPLRVAYASTVHKAQGLSLNRVQVTIRDAFFKTSGMLYVALSRARTAEGLRLVGSEAALVERCTVDPRLEGWL